MDCGINAGKNLRPFFGLCTILLHLVLLIVDLPLVVIEQISRLIPTQFILNPVQF